MAGKKSKAKTADAPVAETPEAAKPAISKSDAVRAALAEGYEQPEDGVQFVKDRYGIEMTRPQFSTTKSLAKKKDAGTDPAPAPMAMTAVRTTHHVAAPPANGTHDYVQSIEAIKVLCDDLGVDQVKRLAEVFRK